MIRGVSPIRSALVMTRLLNPRVWSAAVLMSVLAIAIHAGPGGPWPSPVFVSPGSDGLTGLGYWEALACIGCASCVVATGMIAAGGPGSILIAVNTPGSAVAAMACVAVCYEAVQ